MFWEGEGRSGDGFERDVVKAGGRMWVVGMHGHAVWFAAAFARWRRMGEFCRDVRLTRGVFGRYFGETTAVVAEGGVDIIGQMESSWTVGQAWEGRVQLEQL